MAFDAGTIYSELRLDRTPFNQGLALARTDALRFENLRPSARLLTDTSGFYPPLNAARIAAADFGSLRPEIDIVGDASQFFGTSGAVRTDSAVLSSLNPTVHIGARDAATPALNSVLVAAGVVDAARPIVDAGAETAGAHAKLTALEGHADRVDDDDVTIDARLNDQASGPLGMLGRRLRDTDGDAGGLATRLRGVDASARVMATGGIIAATGALGPLTAAALAGGAALAGVGAGFGLVAAAAIGAFNDIEYKEGQFVAKEEATLTQSQQRLVKQLNVFAGAYASAMRPAESAVISLAVNVLQFLQPALATTGTTATRSVQAVGQAFETIKAALTLPAQATIFNTYLSALPGLAGSATTAAGYLATAIFNIFAVPVNSGLAQQLLNYLTDILGRFLAFTQSVEGQNAIYNFFAQAAPVAATLAWAVGEVAKGIWALVNSGAAQQLATNIALLLGVIGQNLPNLYPFIWIMNQMLNVFLGLPAPVQSAVITLAAFNSILGLLGLGSLFSLVSGLTQLVFVSGLLKVAGLPSALSLIGTGLSGITGAIWGFVAAVFSGLVSAATYVGTFFATTLPAAVGVGAIPLYAALLTILGSWTYILGPAGLIVGVLIAFAAFVAGGWVALVVAAIASAFIAIGVALYRNWDTIKVWGDQVAAWWGGLPPVWQNALSVALAAFSPLTGLFTTLTNAYNTLTTGGYETGFTAWFGSLPGWLYSAFSSALSSVSIFGPLFSVIDQVVAWFDSGGPQGIIAWFANLPGWLANAVIEGLQSVSPFTPLIDLISQIIDWMGAGDMVNAWVTAGKNWIIGLINGIASKAKDLWNTLVNLAKDAYNAAWNVVSGSPPFFGFGKASAEGAALGFAAGTPLVAKRARRMAQRAYEAAASVGAPTLSAAGSGVGSRSLVRPKTSRRRRRDMAIINVNLDGQLLKTYVEQINYDANRRSLSRASHLGGGGLR